MPFYEYRQNNSGGEFHKPAKFIYIEANTAYEANGIAYKYGIYYYGVIAGIDCECCGNRWEEAHEESEPIEVIRADIMKYIKMNERWGTKLPKKVSFGDEYLIVFADGKEELGLLC